MKWRVELRPEMEQDVILAAAWYEEQHPGLGAKFREEIFEVFDSLAENPMLNSRRHPRRNIRWKYPNRFPYRVIYEVLEQQQTVIIAAVLHAARHDREWRRRL